MKMFAIQAAALAVLSSAALVGAHAAPMFSSVGTQVTSGYIQVDCMDRSANASGCWRVGSDYGPLSSGYGTDQDARQTAPGQLDGYRGYFNKSDNTKADALYHGGSH
jgi:hypothetical protein